MKYTYRTLYNEACHVIDRESVFVIDVVRYEVRPGLHFNYMNPFAVAKRHVPPSATGVM